MNAADACKRRFPGVPPHAIDEAVSEAERLAWPWSPVTSNGPDAKPIILRVLFRRFEVPYPLAVDVAIWASLTPATRAAIERREEEERHAEH